METKRVREQLDAVARAAGVEQRDLWPTIHARLTERRTTRAPLPAPALGQRAVALLLAVVVALLATGTALATPAGRALIQQFGLVLAGPAPAADPATITAAQPGPLTAPNVLLSLEVAQRQVDFVIPQPAWLPAGLVLQGVHVGHGPGGGQTLAEVQASSPVQVELVYRLHAQATAGLFVQVTAGPVAGGYTFPREHAQEALVDGAPAVYIAGAWDEHGAWVPTADYQALSWERDGLTFLLRTSELGLAQANLVRIAESLR